MSRPLLPLAALAGALAACSLRYDDPVSVEDAVPEFMFHTVVFERYEESGKKMALAADSLEQYKDAASSYAAGVQFALWDDARTLTTEGACDLMGLNSQDSIYTMFGHITIKDYQQNTEITAENLKWNGTTEQLTAGVSDRVMLRRKDLELEGTGFSASGVSKSFSFANSVAGTIDTDAED